MTESESDILVIMFTLFVHVIDNVTLGFHNFVNSNIVPTLIFRYTHTMQRTDGRMKA